MNPTFIEVCSGGGGLSCGLIQSGFKPLLLNEIDKICCATLAANHINIPINHGSITDLNLTNYKNNVDLLCGGVPCQSFSTAGKRRGLSDPRGRLIYDFIRLIKECNPKYFLIENVLGLVKQDFFPDLLKQLSIDNHYKVDYQLLNSKDYEVPQRRQRVIIIGIRHDDHDVSTTPFNYPIPSSKHILLKDVLTNVPDSPGVLYTKRKEAMYKLIPQGGNWRSMTKEKQLELLGEAFIRNRPSAGVLKRLSMDDFSMTLTTAPDQNITSRCHPLYDRPLTIREYARIQTFPDSYNFCGSIRQQYKQIGNAVPVRLAYFIGKAIIDHLHST